MPDLPLITQEAIDAGFRILEKMDVELDENPLEFGPRRLNQKVAEARRMLSDTEGLFLKVAAWIQKYKAAHRAAETLLGLNKKNLIANDPETRVGRNAMVQDAIASMKLREDVEEVAGMSAVLEDLDALLAVVKAKRTDLKDIQGRLRDQMKLCQEELGLGNKWGSKPPPGSVIPDLDEAPDVDRTTLKELHEMFAGVRVAGTDLNEALAPETELPAEVEETEGVGEGVPDPETAEEHIVAQGAKKAPVPEPEPPPTPPEERSEIGKCAVCKGPQYQTEGGTTCDQHHEGAPTLDTFQKEAPAEESTESTPLGELLGETGGSDSEADGFLTALHTEEEPVRKSSIDIESLFEDFDID